MIEAISAVTLGTPEEQRDQSASDILILSRRCGVTSKRTQCHFVCDNNSQWNTSSLRIQFFRWNRRHRFSKMCSEGRMDAAENCNEVAILSRCSAFPSVFAALSRWNWKLAGCPCHGAQELAVQRRC
jgi:hypothetical protein